MNPGLLKKRLSTADSGVADGGSYSVLPRVSPADGSHGSHGGRARKDSTGRDSAGLCRQDAGSTFRRSIPTPGGYR